MNSSTNRDLHRSSWLKLDTPATGRAERESCYPSPLPTETLWSASRELMRGQLNAAASCTFPRIMSLYPDIPPRIRGCRLIPSCSALARSPCPAMPLCAVECRPRPSHFPPTPRPRDPVAPLPRSPIVRGIKKIETLMSTLSPVKPDSVPRSDLLPARTKYPASASKAIARQH